MAGLDPRGEAESKWLAGIHAGDTWRILRDVLKQIIITLQATAHS